MTDEEIAKERATIFTNLNYNEPDNYGTAKEIGYDAYYCGFIEGLKANRQLNRYQGNVIETILYSMIDLLIYKNQMYGNSALKPKNIFYKGDSTNSILIRLDDKLNRVMNNQDEKPRVNDVCDIIGYCTLLLVSMGVKPEDIEKLKD